MRTAVLTLGERIRRWTAGQLAVFWGALVLVALIALWQYVAVSSTALAEADWAAKIGPARANAGDAKMRSRAADSVADAADRAVIDAALARASTNYAEGEARRTAENARSDSVIAESMQALADLLENEKQRALDRHRLWAARVRIALVILSIGVAAAGLATSWYWFGSHGSLPKIEHD